MISTRIGKNILTRLVNAGVNELPKKIGYRSWAKAKQGKVKKDAEEQEVEEKAKKKKKKKTARNAVQSVENPTTF